MSDADRDASELLELGRSAVERARAAGADVAEASVHSGSHLSVKVRMREPELVEEAGSAPLTESAVLANPASRRRTPAT